MGNAPRDKNSGFRELLLQGLSRKQRQEWQPLFNAANPIPEAFWQVWVARGKYLDSLDQGRPKKKRRR